jgi:hypothetical protein
MNVQKYQPWLKSPLNEEQPIWIQQVYLYLIDMAVMMVGAWIFLFIGHFILKMLIADRG